MNCTYCKESADTLDHVICEIAGTGGVCGV